MMVFADRLLEFTSAHADEIARQWWEEVRKNRKTPSYAALSERKYRAQAVALCHELKRIYHSPRPYDEEMGFFAGYARDVGADSVPLNEAIYALVLLRRAMWLHAESQAVFTSAVDLNQALESINRVVLIFDYAIYIVSKGYGEA